MRVVLQREPRSPPRPPRPPTTATRAGSGGSRWGAPRAEAARRTSAGSRAARSWRAASCSTSWNARVTASSCTSTVRLSMRTSVHPVRPVARHRFECACSTHGRDLEAPSRGLATRAVPSSRTPTTWSSARPPRSPAGPARARTSSTAWSPAARPASTGCSPTSAAACARPSRSSRARIVGVDGGRVPRPAGRDRRVRRAAAADAGRGDPAPPSRDRRHRQLPRHVRTRALNQADHIAVGRGVLDAARDAGNRWIFPDQLERGAGALGRRPRGVGRRLPRGPARRRHHRHLRRRGRVAGGPRGLHRRARLGGLRPARVPRGVRPGRPASASGCRSRRRSRSTRSPGAGTRSRPPAGTDESPARAGSVATWAS